LNDETDTLKAAMAAVPITMGLLAELTHRCPLRCPYCSNPLELTRRSDELSTGEWIGVFRQAAEIGVLHVHLSGGEPASRRDLGELTTGAREAGLYTNLITSGVGLTEARFDELVERGLDHVQLSIQGADAATADRIGGYKRGFETKMRLAGWIGQAGLPLTVNAVMHRQNLDQLAEAIELAVRLGARRFEVANAQYYGWAYRNRHALMPNLEQVKRCGEVVAEAVERLRGTMVIDYVTPDYLGSFPKPCMGGWARVGLCVTPDGTVLPCHAAETITSLAFENVRDRPLAGIWADGPAFVAYRGTEWMGEPCQSCERKTRDWGGCRCQAFALTGDAGAVDPVCSKSPDHAAMRAAAIAEAGRATDDFEYRVM